MNVFSDRVVVRAHHPGEHSREGPVEACREAGRRHTGDLDQPAAELVLARQAPAVHAPGHRLQLALAPCLRLLDRSAAVRLGGEERRDRLGFVERPRDRERALHAAPVELERGNGLAGKPGQADDERMDARLDVDYAMVDSLALSIRCAATAGWETVRE